MRLVWKSFSLCKEGNREDENEDAVYPQLMSGISMNAERFICAVADGATLSSFSRQWAGLLVKGAGLSQDLGRDYWRVVNEARLSWKTSLPDSELPWPAAIKVRQGAFATLLWFHIWHINGVHPSGDAPGNHGWTANAVGDTCLFQVVKGKFGASFPFSKAAQFSNTPDLISSNQAYSSTGPGRLAFSGKWQKGDHFLLATDALSEWMIRNLERGILTWPMVSENLTSLVRYQTWIRSLRRQSQIKNDDTSLVCLTVDD